MNNKKNKMGLLAIILSVFMVAGVMAGCGSYQADLNEQIPAAGSFLLKVNPEIKVSFDLDGQVTTIEGKNNEGKAIVEQMNDATGKPVKEIVNELVTNIYNSGYLVDEIEGSKRTITFEIESGSRIPSEDFITQITIDVEQLLATMNMDSDIRVTNMSDYDDSDDSDYDDSDYDDSDVSDYDDSDYDDSDVSDYDDSDYDNSDYSSQQTTSTTTIPAVKASTQSTTRQASSDDSDYDDSDYDDSDYDDSDYDDSDYDDSEYDDSEDDDSDYDDSDYSN